MGILRALGSCVSMISTFTILPFIPGGWVASAGGSPAMSEAGAILMKDLVLLAASFYLLKQDLIREAVGDQSLQNMLDVQRTFGRASNQRSI
jgi:uncharacterized membrane protein YkgB